jgi:hypothetical protein
MTTRRSIRRSRAVDRGTAVLVISRLLRRPIPITHLRAALEVVPLAVELRRRSNT